MRKGLTTTHDRAKTVHQNGDALNASGANEKIYGKKVTGEEIFSGGLQAPASAEFMLTALKDKSPRPTSRGKS
jgi:lipid-binding SYLF domain-containing protein